MKKIEKIIKYNGNVEIRIDNFIKKNSDFSKSKIHYMILNGMVMCNNVIILKKNYILSYDDIVSFYETDSIDNKITKSKIDVDIVFEDENIIIVDKLPGISAHPGAGCNGDTILNALIDKIDVDSYIGSEMVPGVVHRIDKNTSGLMLFTKNINASKVFKEIFKNKLVTRKYNAVVWGAIFPYFGTINKPIARDSINRKTMIISEENGKEAITHYKTIKIFNDQIASFVECELETGRTHQIRVHFSYIGHGIVGDNTYGKKIQLKKNINNYEFINSFRRQALHSSEMFFINPFTSKSISIKSKIPQDMMNLLMCFDY